MQCGVTNPAILEVVSCTEAQVSPRQGDLVSLVRHTSPTALLAALGKGEGPRPSPLPAGRDDPAAPARRSAFHRCRTHGPPGSAAEPPAAAQSGITNSFTPSRTHYIPPGPAASSSLHLYHAMEPGTLISSTFASTP